MVEAAVVFPLIILTLITCMLICMFFYSRTVEQSRLHILLRQEAGEISGHTEYMDPPAKTGIDLERRRKGLFYVVSGKEHIAMKSKGMLRGRTDRSIEGLWTAADGVSYVRHCTLVKDLVDMK